METLGQIFAALGTFFFRPNVWISQKRNEQNYWTRDVSIRWALAAIWAAKCDKTKHDWNEKDNPDYHKRRGPFWSSKRVQKKAAQYKVKAAI